MSSHLITLRGVRFNRRPLCFASSRGYEVRATVTGFYLPPDSDADEDRGSFKLQSVVVHSIATGPTHHYVWQESTAESPRGLAKVDDLFVNDDDLADAIRAEALAMELEDRGVIA